VPQIVVFIGISQSIVLFAGLQFIKFCARALAKQSTRCCGLLSTNRSEKVLY